MGFSRVLESGVVDTVAVGCYHALPESLALLTSTDKTLK